MAAKERRVFSVRQKANERWDMTFERLLVQIQEPFEYLLYIHPRTEEVYQRVVAFYHRGSKYRISVRDGECELWTRTFDHYPEMFIWQELFDKLASI
jgi:hypothetical protein